MEINGGKCPKWHRGKRDKIMAKKINLKVIICMAKNEICLAKRRNEKASISSEENGRNGVASMTCVVNK